MNGVRGTLEQYKQDRDRQKETERERERQRERDRQTDRQTETETERQRETLFVVGCLISQQHASVSQGGICSIGQYFQQCLFHTAARHDTAYHLPPLVVWL